MFQRAWSTRENLVNYNQGCTLGSFGRQWGVGWGESCFHSFCCSESKNSPAGVRFFWARYWCLVKRWGLGAGGQRRVPRLCWRKPGRQAWWDPPEAAASCCGEWRLRCSPTYTGGKGALPPEPPSPLWAFGSAEFPTLNPVPCGQPEGRIGTG